MAIGSLIETRSIDYVPLAERHGKVWHLWPVWFSGDAHLATLAVGAVGISLGGNLLWTAVAVILGCLLGTFFMAFHSTQGPQLGLPQMIQSATRVRCWCGAWRWSPTSATTPSIRCWRRRRCTS
jgi:purine-cytosine permease-like protein